MKYCVILLVHNLQYFEIMLKNMPTQDSKITFVICNDDRVVNLESEIKVLCRKYCKLAKFRFLPIRKTNEYIRETLRLTEAGKKFLNEYTMGGNINPVYYLKDKFEKFLILDDDVLILKDLIDVFECEESENNMYVANFLSSGRGRENDPDMHKWLKFSGVDFDTYMTNNINGGQKIYNAKYMEIYGNLLEQFYNSSWFRENWKTWKTTGKQKSKAWFMDQYFDNAFAWKIGQNAKRFNTLGKFCRIIFSLKSLLKNKSKYLDSYVIHYCCGKDKFKFVEILQEEGLLK